MKRNKFLGLLVCLSCILNACQAEASQSADAIPSASVQPPPQPTDITTEAWANQATHTSTPSISATLITTSEVSEFGWIDEEHVYYSVQNGNEFEWRRFDLLARTDEAIGSIHPEASPGVRTLTNSNLGAGILAEVVAPSRERVIYARLPEGYENPSFETPIPDYFPPAELWLADATTGTNALLSSEFASRCGELNSDGHWLDNETIYFGSCAPFMGPPEIYFVADIAENRTDYLSYISDSAGNYPFGMVLAHHEQSIAFTDGGDSMWIIQSNEIAQTLASPIDPNTQIVFSGAIRSPRWSSDDTWIYYWYSNLYSPDRADYPLTLHRINTATRETEQVISEEAMLAMLGKDTYAFFSLIYFLDVHWELSPDDHRALLKISSGYNQPAEFLLISWP